MPSRVPRSWIFFLVGIGVIVGAMLLTSPRGPAKAPTTPEEVGTEPAPWEQTFADMQARGGDAIMVAPQDAGTTEVRITALVTEAGGWVAVFDDNAGVPGGVLGFAPSPFQDEDVTVHVDRPLSAGDVYYAILYRDDGDGKFDPTKDRQAADGEGNVAIMSFEAK